MSRTAARSPRHLGVILFVWLTACTLQVIITACPQGWYSWRDSCYIPLAESLSWFEATEACQHPGGGLIVPNSREEHDFIISLRDKSFSQPSIRSLWIGCEIINHNLKCLGDTNGDDAYTNWYSDTAPDVSGTVCVYKGSGLDGKLSAEDCGRNTRSVMCEMPSLIVPTYCVSFGADGRVAPQCLQGHGIKNLTVESVSECGQVCWAEHRCRSFNLWPEGPAKICQLNDATRREVSIHDFIAQGNCIYFDL